MESCLAMWTPAEALVAPGPRVTKQMPGRPGQLADRLRHHGGAAFLAADRDLDVAIMEGVEHRKVAFARNAERVVDAIGDQVVDQHLGGRAGVVLATHCRHSGILSRLWFCEALRGESSNDLE